MLKTLIVENRHPVEIYKIVQIAAPGVFDDCNTALETANRMKAYSNLLKNEYKIDTIHILESPIPKSEHLVACLFNLACHYFEGKRDGYCYRLELLWFQENYAFPIDPHILEKIKALPFRQIASKTEEPF